MTSFELDWLADATEQTADHGDESTEQTADHGDESTEQTADHGDESTEQTADHDDESTEQTADDKLRMSADSTEATAHDEFQPKGLSLDHTDATLNDEFQPKGLSLDHTDDTSGYQPKGIHRTTLLPASEIIVRDIAVTAAVSALPSDSNAAFSQWLSGSGLSPRN